MKAFRRLMAVLFVQDLIGAIVALSWGSRPTAWFFIISAIASLATVWVAQWFVRETAAFARAHGFATPPIDPAAERAQARVADVQLMAGKAVIGAAWHEHALARLAMLDWDAAQYGLMPFEEVERSQLRALINGGAIAVNGVANV